MSAAAAPASGRLAGVGGVEIFWRQWPAQAAPRALIVIAHGAGEHSGRYEHVATRLNREGYAVVALDHRGHGRSGGPRALISRMDDAVADLHALVQETAGEHPSVPRFLLGHSMGGTIALRYAAAHGEWLSGLLLSGPLAAVEAAPPLVRVLVPRLSAVLPRLPALAVDPALISRDPSVVEAYRTDPLVHHGKLPVRTVAELGAAVAALPDTAAAIRVPTWLGYGTADRLCPPAGSVMLTEHLAASELTVEPYEGLAHEILNEPERETVLDDLCQWLRARAGSR